MKDIQYPTDLRKLKESDLEQVCKELRQYIIDIVSVHGGHFAASLGVIELTVALHYVLNTPYDQLLFDVGHQAYGHKILTGRKDVFYTNRILGGISGFPKRSESEYDAFGVGHSSTSISAALGAAVAAANGLIHATPTGMAKFPGLPLPAEMLHPRLWVAEIVYFPLETELLRTARSIGCRTLDGGGMAVFQAVDAFRLFTGVSPDADRIRAHFASMDAGRSAA